ncbi:hypothetical protein J5289_16235 [Rhizobium sp. B230/85]|uniref:hypothetical protein n=1 Tax=unclassified Rhizobium TaxID=2613769 RepID=UPI001ADB6565|nr:MULTISPECIES: hypothetical protein [unclassified Rhizobium]MBO9131727.1 hypothetical protein [Rhizobium sp. B209b/85]QXZ95705.1 hypothetical protein J5289_16235 [Rhizobium sp. B230/85]
MKRSIVRSLRIAEISGVDRPAQSNALVTIMKSGEPTALKNLEITELSLVNIGANVDARVALTKSAAQVSEEIMKISPDVRRRANEYMAEQLRKSEDRNMSETPKTTDDMLRLHMEKHDLTETQSFRKLMDNKKFAELYDQEDAAKQAVQARQIGLSH